MRILFRSSSLTVLGARNVGTDAKSNPEGFVQGFNDNPFHRYLGLEIVEQRADYALAFTAQRFDASGIGGSVHGGVIATMIDMAAVVSVLVICPIPEVQRGLQIWP